jgi:glucose/arabinose dehydrogenase
MRFGGLLVLGALLWGAAAAAQPVIVDPTPDPEDTTDWDLALEPDPVVSGLATPTGLVLIGTRKDEELLVLEKNTGRVRHYKNDALGVAVDQGDALDLGVDNCGERGLIAIALHPSFDRSTPGTSDPEAPQKDHVFLSYHTDAGAGPGDDNCDGDAIFRVERYAWNGTQLTDPLVVYSQPLADGENTQVGGGISMGQELDIEEDDFYSEFLYVAVGSLGRDGTLQNNEDLDPRVLDDTSVVLRLNTDGTTPEGNPFDVDPDVDAPKDRYFAYGFRDAKALLVDRASGYIWLSERSDGGFDELDVFQTGDNGGHADYKGLISNVPKNLDGDGEPNPLYLLVDLLTELKNTERVPVSTYVNPPFSFESPDVHPTGLAFGGLEVGPQHRDDLFVGTEDGRLLRFPVNSIRQGFSLSVPLADTIANLGEDEDDPETDEDETEPDSFTQVLIAEGFGAISDLETGVDGSLYVVDQANGSIHRIFFDAKRDLAVHSIKAPKKISLSAKKPEVTKAVQVTLVNQGEVAERIGSREELENLIGFQLSSPTGCAIPTATIVDPKYALPPYPYQIGIAPNGGQLSLDVSVAWACDSPFDAGANNFEASVTIDLEAIGVVELPADQADNVCPRPPDPAADPPDPGCGAKLPDKTLGGPIVTDVTIK